MKYTAGSFSVVAPGTDQYRENYERTFGKKKPLSVPVEVKRSDTIDSSISGSCRKCGGPMHYHEYENPDWNRWLCVGPDCQPCTPEQLKEILNAAPLGGFPKCKQCGTDMEFSDAERKDLACPNLHCGL